MRARRSFEASRTTSRSTRGRGTSSRRSTSCIFDEAQRAWDKDRVAESHEHEKPKSEPEHFIEFAERIPEWCVVIGLIGTGQEIHIGEEGGLVQCEIGFSSLEGCAQPGSWTVHGAPRAAPEVFGVARFR